MNNDSGPARKLLQSGIIYTAINFITGLGNLAFQAVIGRHLSGAGQYGDTNTVISGFLPLLGLPPQIAILTVTHYIAHFNTSGDHARLQGLILGCRKFLFWFTVAGSVLAVLAVKPLSAYFHFSTGLMLTTLGCSLLGLWGAYATTLCQGLAWFKRLALIGLLMMVLRFTFGWLITLHWPSAETAVMATGFALLANLILLCWRKELVLQGKPVAPWSRSFARYFMASTACVVGGFCFVQGDTLIAKKFFHQDELDAYTAVGTLARAVPQGVAPLLAVLFTSRSSRRAGGIVTEQLKLIGLSALALFFGAALLFILRHLCLRILGRETPGADTMVGPYALTMVFAGLLQGLAFWALASRWSKITLLYGVLGVSYWLILMATGHTPMTILQIMPMAVGSAFLILLGCWLLMMWRHQPAVTEPEPPPRGNSEKVAHD